MTDEDRLRVGGWVPESGDTSLPVPARDGVHPVIDAEPVGTVTEAWLPATMPDPNAGVAGDEDYGPYRGRRRLAPTAVTLRRAAVVAVVVGTLLVGTSVLMGLLAGDREAQLAPPPTPLVRVDPSPGGDLDQERVAPSASPPPSSAPSSSPAALPAVNESFQAEAAGLGSHAQALAVDGAAGGEAVRLSGNRDGTFVRFAGIDVVDSGQYEVTIAYFCEQDRSGAVTVNGGAGITVAFPSRGEGGTIGSVTVSVELAAGGNTIVISTDGGAPLTIDQIAITG